MLRALTIAVALAASAAVALAQETAVPVMGGSGEDAPVTAEAPQAAQVLVLGDAIGGGLGAGLLRLGEASGRFDVTIRFNVESGLARPEVYDWAATVPKILESYHYDYVVVMIGANDRQMIKSGNERYGFGSQGWTTAYRRQMDLLLDALVQSGARVYWVSLPPMANAGYDEAMKAVNVLQRERVEARGMTYVDITPALTKPDGSYSDTGRDDTGTVQKLRASDGVSFFKAGNNLMAQLVIDALGKTAPPPSPAETKTSLPVSAEAATAPPAPPPAPARPQVPSFGQAGLDGDSLVISPDDVTATALLVGRSGTASPAALEAIRAMAPEGSEAQNLFVFGRPSRAPRGRVDDFTVPPDAN